jgi:hypothetical protein
MTKKNIRRKSETFGGAGRVQGPDSRECSILRHRVWVVIPEMDAKVKSVGKQSAPGVIDVFLPSEV